MRVRIIIIFTIIIIVIIIVNIIYLSDGLFRLGRWNLSCSSNLSEMKTGRKKNKLEANANVWASSENTSVRGRRTLACAEGSGMWWF